MNRPASSHPSSPDSPSGPAPLRRLRFALLLPTTALALLLLPACGATGGGPGPGDVNGYLTDLPDWSAFSPEQPDADPAPTGEAPTVLPEQTVEAPARNEDGEIERHPEGSANEGEPLDTATYAYTCTDTPYTLTENPQQVVMYNPDASILWPGSLIQGRSFRDGGSPGDLLGLTIAERAPITVAITDFFNDNPSQVVQDPSLDTVTRAIGDMVGSAAAQNLDTPSTIAFEMETYHSESSFAATANVSGRYLGFSGSASGSTSRNAAETTVAVHFYQQMFTVSVPPPQTPGGFFSEAFSGAKLQEQIDLGRIGPDNLPVYISEIVYGRMMMFTVTSTATESELKGAVSAAYNGIGGNISGSITAAQRNVLQQARYAITSYGGPADATEQMIRSLNWQDYFTASAPLTTARPLSYTFRNLSDGSIARVSEATDYNIRECTARVATPGTFDFAAVQRSDDMPIETPYTPHVGDFNGDDRTDLLFNHLQSSNEIMIAFGNERGGFDLFSAPPVDFDPETDELDPLAFFEHPANPVEGWGNYQVRVLELNDDDCDDLVWNVAGEVAGTNVNKSYTALASCDDPVGFAFSTVSEHPSSAANGWELYELLIGDIDGDNLDDLVWNITQSGIVNRSYVALSDGAGDFDYLDLQDYTLSGNVKPTGWGPYSTFLGNANGDAFADLIFSDRNSRRVYQAYGTADGTLIFNAAKDDGPFGSAQFCGTEESRLMANVDSDPYLDFVSVGLDCNRADVQTSFGLGDTNHSVPSGEQTHSQAADEIIWALYEPATADVNGDGRDDLIWHGAKNDDTTLRRIVTWIAGDNRSAPFDDARALQDHPLQLDWNAYSTLFGDVDGDGLDDMIWVFPGTTNRIFVGIAKNE